MVGRLRNLGVDVPHSLRLAIKVATVYAIIAGAWSAGSDYLAEAVTSSEHTLTSLQTYKGWLFVLVTAGLLFALVYTSYRNLYSAQRAKDESYDRLNLALRSARGGVWDRDLTDGSLHISSQLKSMIGFNDDELSSSSREWAARIHPDDLPTVREGTRRAIADPTRGIQQIQYRVRHKDGGYRWFQSRAKVLTGSNGDPVRMIGVALDISDQVESERRLLHLTEHDAVTALPNRRTFLQHLGVMLALGGTSHTRTVVASIDVDQFKLVINRFGSRTGDAVLRAVADRIGEAAGNDGLVGHIAGDEFIVAVPKLYALEHAHRMVKRLSAAFDTPLEVGGHSIGLSVSIGAAVYPEDGETTEDLLNGAAIALNSAREYGRGSAHFLEPGMDRTFRLKASRANDLRHAVARGEIEIHYQPIVGLDSGRTIAFEALARWQRPGEGLVPPDEFIGLAEDLGIIGEIGNAVLRRACQDACTWHSDSGSRPYVAVNVSPRQFDDPDFVNQVQQILDETGLDALRLELEITESALAFDPDAASQRVEALREYGIAIAIDDFGTGFSSLGALHRLPLTRLKIDKSFVNSYGTDASSSATADAILGLARTLGFRTTAEGVETQWQMAALRHRRADAAQGYLFSRPVPHDQVAPLVDRDWLNEFAVSSHGSGL